MTTFGEFLAAKIKENNPAPNTKVHNVCYKTELLAEAIRDIEGLFVYKFQEGLPVTTGEKFGMDVLLQFTGYKELIDAYIDFEMGNKAEV
jgi:hypothetical protein